MRKALRNLAAILLVGVITFWVAKGANCGWTQNQVPRKLVDPVTGIVGVTYVKKFVPGVDFLAAAVAGAGILAGASFLFRNKKLATETQLK